MAKAVSGDTVRFHYTGTLEDGSEFDTSAGGEPVEITIGDGAVMPCIEEALVGMAPGDVKSVTVIADDAYGPHREELVQEIDRARFPPEIDLEVGRTLQATGPEGRTLHLTVLSISDSAVTVDLNHPLAGKDLTFELQLVEIV